MSLLTCPCLRRKRVEKSKAILEHLMTFRSNIWTGRPEKLLSLMCVFFGFLKSSVRLKFMLSLYTSNDLTYSRIRFKKPLDIFWPQIQRKGSEDYLVMILAVNRKLWATFLASSSSWKRANAGKPALNINKLMLTWLMISRHFTLNTCLREWNLLSLYMRFTELYLFYWLLVVSLAIFIAAPVVSSRT